MKTSLIELQQDKHLTSKKPDLENPEFGKLSTDHMIIVEYSNGYWQKPVLKTFHNISLHPFASGLHYGQTVFEGLKAFRTKEGRINIFRPQKHAERFRKSLHRMCMPDIPVEMFMEAVTTLVRIDSDWVPDSPDSSLYIRPFVFATENRLGVKESDNYIFMVVASPSGRYHSKPLRVKVETEFVRTFEGGTGTAKCGGNYGGSFFAARAAKQQGFDQILWTDAINHEYIEESGMMNVGFIIDNKFITPPLTSTILDGVTRDSMLVLAQETGMEIEMRKISYNELFEEYSKGKKIEAFGIGTAAVVSPIIEITAGNRSIHPYYNEDAKILKLKQLLYEIRIGLKEDKYGWIYQING